MTESIRALNLLNLQITFQLCNCEKSFHRELDEIEYGKHVCFRDASQLNFKGQYNCTVIVIDDLL